MIDRSTVPNYRAMHSLQGGTALVVGAGNGIGRQTAHALAAADATVLCADIDAERAQAVAGEVGGQAIVADACGREGAREMAAEVVARSGGQLAAVVDIIGISTFRTLAEHDAELWETSRRMNFEHAVYLAQWAGPELAKGGGSLVYVASVSGLFAAQRHAAYGAYKAALLSFVKSAAVELGPQGVRVNAVAPGVIWTNRIASAIGEERREQFTAQTPLGRLGEPSDVASVIGFLATGASRHVSGQSIVIDGGLGVRFPYPVETL